MILRDVSRLLLGVMVLELPAEPWAIGNMGFYSVKIIFISKKLELITLKSLLPFLVVSPHLFLVE